MPGPFGHWTFFEGPESFLPVAGINRSFTKKNLDMTALSTPLLCFLFVFISVVISVVGLLIVRKFFPKPVIEGDEVEAAVALFGTIGTVYAVILAFLVVMVWQRYENEQERTVLEACQLANLYNDMRGFPAEEERKIQGIVRQYTRILIDDAWPLMSEGRESKKAWKTFNTLYSEIIHYSPSDYRQIIIYDRLMNHLNELNTYRRLRLLSAQEKGVPDVLWAVMLGSGLITMLFSYFFRIGTIRVQVVMTALTGGMFGVVLFLILLFNHPYRSSIQVSPAPFVNLLEEVFPESDRTDKAGSNLK